MRRIAFFVLLCGFLPLNLALASEVAVQFDEANQAYRSGNFDKAAQRYEQILSQGYETADLHYNLGNAYYKLNKLPSAILEYERAMRLSPGDEDIAHNLALANLHLTDRIEPLPDLFFIGWWKSYVNMFSADRWAWNGLIALWLTLLCAAILFLGFHQPFLRRVLPIVALAGLVVFVVCLIGMFGRVRIENSRRFAILQSPSVHVRSAPDEKSTDLFVIHEGLKVELLDNVSGWSKVRLADGKIGWITTNSFEVI